MGKTRGRYKVYSADNSVEVPRVTLWRMRRIYDNGKASPVQHTEPRTEETADEMARLDNFHNKAMSSVCFLYQ